MDALGKQMDVLGKQMEREGERANTAVRALIREQKITCNTAGMYAGYAQANLIVLPRALAFDFLLFAQKNPYACPVLEV